jgi:hypothetical protein
VMQHPPAADALIDEVSPKLKQPGDVAVVVNQSKTCYYVLVLKDRKEPRAADPSSLKDFDRTVIAPDPKGQLRVENQSLSEFVVRQRAEQFEKSWEERLRQLAHYDADKAKRFADHLRDLRPDE